MCTVFRKAIAVAPSDEIKKELNAKWHGFWKETADRLISGYYSFDNALDGFHFQPTGDGHYFCEYVSSPTGDFYHGLELLSEITHVTYLGQKTQKRSLMQVFILAFVLRS